MDVLLRTVDAAPSDSAAVAELRPLIVSESDLAALVDATRDLGGRAESGEGAARADAACRVLIALADEVAGAALRLAARRARVRILAHVGRFEEAIDVGRGAINLADDAGEQIESARIRLALMHPYTELGRLDDATAFGEEARRMLVDADAPAMAGRADINLGIAWLRRGQPTRAVACLTRARPLVDSEPPIVAALENSLGEALVVLDRFDDAAESFRRAREAFASVGQTLEAAVADGNLADLAFRQGRLDLALAAFERARRRLTGDAFDVHRARLLAEEADARAMVGLDEVAADRYAAALPILDRFGLALEAARARLGLGRVLARLGQPTESATLLSAAATGFAELGNRAARARTDLARASLALDMGRVDAAAALASGALGAFEGRVADSAAARMVMARIAAAAGDDAVAEADLAAGRALAGRLDIAPLLAEFEAELGALRRRQNRPKDAVAAFAAAVGYLERVRGNLQARRFRVAFADQGAGIYAGWRDALIAESGPHLTTDLFRAIEYGRSRTLLDGLGPRATSVTVAPGAPDAVQASPADDASAQLRVAIDDERAALNALYSRIGDATVHVAQPSEPNDWRAEVRRREVALEELESRFDAESRAVTALARPIELDAFQRTLAGDDAAVIWIWTPDGPASLVVRQGHAELSRPKINRTAADGLIRRFRFQIDRALRPGATAGPRGARLVDDARRAASELTASLGDRWRESIADAARIIMVPDGPLHLMPPAAMHDEHGWFGERAEVLLAPSASVHARLRELPDPVPGPGLCVGVGDPDVPQIEAEARSVADSWTGSVDLMVGDAARSAAVLSAMRQATSVHLACHGRFDRGHPMGSGLRLADRWLTVRDLHEERVVADLVTLSGCETGLGRADDTGEVTGLGRALLAAGARRVVASLWRVDDAVAADTMIALYRRRSAGQGVVEALSHTLADIRAEHPHPAHWAAFVAIGRN